MKTKLIFLFLSLALVCSAQSQLKFITFNIPDVRQFSDSIAMNAKETFKFDSQGVPLDNRIYYVVTYINTTDASDSIVVMFRINYIGGTGDAVNPGTPQYSYTRTTGKLQNLYPFWLKFMNPAAELSVLQDKKKDEAIVKGATYDFYQEKAHWRIEKF
ncbi:MAG: hypothetical protein PHT07_18730 [Paludibacter sp.]|nr:hypothetical protein [Paludibacter sp.]